MAVFRVEKTKNYTVMANHHLQNKKLSLKAKGLLSVMLSLTDEWNYSLRGLASICKDGVDSINGTIKELETNGYITRTRVRNERGQLTNTEYTIYEHPQPKPDKPEQEKPKLENPILDNPTLDNPTLEEPILEKPPQYNTKQLKKKELNINISNPNQSNPNEIEQPKKQMGYEMIGFDSIEELKETVYENIEYEHFCTYGKLGMRERTNEVADIMIETLCSTKQTINIAGEEYPALLVKEKLLKINSNHIEYIFDCLDKNTTYVRNIKRYLVATLFNAPSTIDNYYSALVNHDLKGYKG